MENEVEHHLSADGLVAVHVGHVLHVGLAHHVLVRRPVDDEIKQVVNNRLDYHPDP